MPECFQQGCKKAQRYLDGGWVAARMHSFHTRCLGQSCCLAEARSLLWEGHCCSGTAVSADYWSARHCTGSPLGLWHQQPRRVCQQANVPGHILQTMAALPPHSEEAYCCCCCWTWFLGVSKLLGWPIVPGETPRLSKFRIMTILKEAVLIS